MRINLTVEVESREALAALMQAGREYTLTDCRVIRFRILPAVPASRLEGRVDNYFNAVNGTGPLAAAWKDKPHRLVYDLVDEVSRLQKILGEPA